jgi:hypothetical protein
VPWSHDATGLGWRCFDVDFRCRGRRPTYLDFGGGGRDRNISFPVLAFHRRDSIGVCRQFSNALVRVFFRMNVEYKGRFVQIKFRVLRLVVDKRTSEGMMSFVSEECRSESAG